jgi:SAM-dependent methyltransferase
MESTPVAANWSGWLRRWDAQQTGYLPDRERRFEVMFEVLETLLPARFLALDLACGPGALSQRLLARFPEARSIGLDYDPVLLEIGRGALGDAAGRLRWIEADLRRPDWAERLGEPVLDAVLTTTALHWLSAEDLVRTYRLLAERLRPGGVLLNGDHMRFPYPMATFRRVAQDVRERRRAAAFARPGAEDWQAWWATVEREPALAPLVEERRRRFPPRDGAASPSLPLHEAALADAGFREVGVIWQNLDNRVLMAVR